LKHFSNLNPSVILSERPTDEKQSISSRRVGRA
jgi:hypothetical protein